MECNLLVEQVSLLSLGIKSHFTISCDAHTLSEGFFQLFDPVFLLGQTGIGKSIQLSGLVSDVAQLVRQTIDRLFFDADHLLQLLNVQLQLIRLSRWLLFLLNPFIRLAYVL